MIALGMAALAAEVREEVLELAISNHHHTSTLLRAYPRFSAESREGLYLAIWTCGCRFPETEEVEAVI
jgi:hypothetical protein